MQSPHSATTPRILTLIEPVDRVVHAGTFCNHHRHQYWPGLPHWQQKEGCRGLRQFSLKEFIINSLCLCRRPLFTWAERFTIVAIYYALHSVGLFWLLSYISILLPKLFRPTLRKNCYSDRENFSKFLRSLEQFIQTVKGQNKFW